MRLPQCFSFVAEDKRALAKVVYGDKDIPPVEFFKELNKPVDNSDSVSINMAEASSNRVLEVDEASSKLELEVTSTSSETIAQKAYAAAEFLRLLILKHGKKETDDSLAVFTTRMKNIKNDAQYHSFLRTAGSSLFLRNGSLKKKKRKKVDTEEKFCVNQHLYQEDEVENHEEEDVSCEAAA